MQKLREGDEDRNQPRSLSARTFSFYGDTPKGMVEVRKGEREGGREGGREGEREGQRQLWMGYICTCQ